MKKIPLIQGGQGRTSVQLIQNPIVKTCQLGMFKIIVILTVCGALALAAHVTIKYTKGPVHVTTQAR